MGLLQVSKDSLSSDLEKVLSLSGLLDRIEKSNWVILKPNLVTDKPEYIALGANTSVEVLETLLSVLADHGCRVGIGESETGTPAKGRRLRLAWERMGLQALADRFGAELLNFSELPSRPVPFEQGGVRSLDLPEAVLDCDLLIDIPKIKTHKYAILTCSMKNLYGLIPEPRRVIYHRWLHEIVAELTSIVAPRCVALVDGLIGMEGNGPLYGAPVDLDLLLAGDNLWAVDRTVCDLIGVTSDNVRYLKIGERMGLPGEGGIEVVGDSLEECRRPFKPVDFNLYRSFEKKLMETPLVHVVTSHWFQKNVSRHIAGLTERLRGGGYSWYLEPDDHS